MIRTITTHSSVWFVDLDKQQYRRTPKTEAPAIHPTHSYEDDWVPFTHCYRTQPQRGEFPIVPMGDQLLVRRATDEHRLISGSIITDSHPDWIITPDGFPAPPPS